MKLQSLSPVPRKADPPVRDIEPDYSGEMQALTLQRKVLESHEASLTRREEVCA